MGVFMCMRMCLCVYVYAYEFMCMCMRAVCQVITSMLCAKGNQYIQVQLEVLQVNVGLSSSAHYCFVLNSTFRGVAGLDLVEM